LQDDILEEIPLDEIHVDEHVWIPHRPVVKESSNTTKVRIVLNCSLKIGNSPSLNEATYPGVDLMNNLLELLIKIRANKYLMISDIRAAFLMINLNLESDKNKFSILWRDANGNLRAYRYRTIVFGYVSSPFMLHQVIHFHLSSFPSDRCTDLLKNNMYVDNLFITSNDVGDLLSLYEESCSRMADGGFQLRSWSSNSGELCDQFEADGCSSAATAEKLLGYRYVPENDEMSINNFSKDINGPLTKRKILSYTASIFDPLGIALPVTARAKLLLRDLWLSKVGWDEPVSKDVEREWTKLKADLDKLPSVSLPRNAYDEDCTLYVCCDSSKKLYGFACYLKSNKNSSCNLIFSKVKTAPNKPRTIPTLELMSVNLALKCLPSVLKPLKGKLTDVVICVDAQVVLSWVLSGSVKTKNICARNKVKEVTSQRQQILTEYGFDCKFRYISTSENPADMITRGLTFDEFQNKLGRWLNGPEFFQQSSVEWKDYPLDCLSDESKVLAMTSTVSERDSIIPVDKFSNVNKLFRVTALVFEFINKLRRKNKSKVDLINDARAYWFKDQQSKFLHKEIAFLNGSEKSTVPPLVNNLNLFLDSSGLLRSGGRTEKCRKFSYGIVHPVLIPRQSFLTNLIVNNVHLELKHMGVASTLAAVRKQGFWIPRGRAVVQSVLAGCITCKKLNAYSFRYPKPGQYISDKVNFDRPYTHVGIDYTGHMYTKIGGTLQKVYLLVYTCLNIRAIHLDLLPDLSCKNFLLSFIRFCNAQGMPSAVYSDNASTFLQGMGIIADSNIDNEFSNYLVKNNVKHNKIPLYSAWCGSAWERQIRTIKNSLHKVVGRKQLDYFQLITLLSDVQHSINSRPLTYASDTDLHNVITPNSFLKFDTGRSLLLSGLAGSELVIPNRAELVRALEKREELFEDCRARWYDEYLLSLREAGRERYQESWDNVIKAGDVVLVETPQKPRHLWQMARVLETLPDNDGVVRCVKLLRADKTEGVHSINLLYPLEISVSPIVDSPDDSGISNDCSENAGNTVASRRPRRAAALRCQETLRSFNQD